MMTTRASRKLLGLALLAAIFAARPVAAQQVTIQPPALSGMDKATQIQRALAIRAARAQRMPLVKQQAAATQLRGMDASSAEFRTLIAVQPARVRAEVFKAKAAELNAPAADHTRRLRGMLSNGKVSRATHSAKQFVEVTPGNFDLFRQVAGPNMVWFSVNDSPGHLHTLLTDQGDGQRFHHNTYGVTTDTAAITANYTQYSMGVQLTDHQLDRLVRYMNAGNAATNGAAYGSEKTTVFGFYNKQKQKVTDIKCTNWVTSAPIGELPRWAATIDRRVSKLAEGGQLAAVPEVQAAGGLHAALAAAATPEARADVVKRVLATPGLTKWNKSAVKRMGKVFQKEMTDFPKRPTDLVLRQSMAQLLGLSRSQDPAKWSFDLLLSKRAPVVAVLNGAQDAGLPQKTLNWEIMGQIGPDGRVARNTSFSTYNAGPTDGARGVVPAERYQPTAKKVRPTAPPTTPDQPSPAAQPAPAAPPTAAQ